MRIKMAKTTDFFYVIYDKVNKDYFIDNQTSTEDPMEAKVFYDVKSAKKKINKLYNGDDCVVYRVNVEYTVEEADEDEE